jgi:C-terminal processing protease CtpA/Prc
LIYRYSAGEVHAGGHRVLVAPHPPSDDSAVPVAVLVDHRDTSAAEGLLIAFRGRNRTRIFGVATAGVPTGNVNYTLADGSLLFNTTSLAVDRLGRSYAAAIEPDRCGGLGEARDWLNAQRRESNYDGE